MTCGWTDTVYLSLFILLLSVQNPEVSFEEIISSTEYGFK